jgi:RHS repeat-associated protein
VIDAATRNFGPWGRRILVSLLASGQILLGIPAAASPQPGGQPAASEATGIQVNRRLPRVSPVPTEPAFSDWPTTDEIFRARVFDEPLVPVHGEPSREENRALARAVAAYHAAGGGERTESFQALLEAGAIPSWRASLLLNLGLVWKATGRPSRALRCLAESWAIARTATSDRGRAVADRAIAELAQLLARLGHVTQLMKVLAEVEGRPIGGTAAELLRLARESTSQMQTRTDMSFRCGPIALGRLLGHETPSLAGDLRILQYPSSPRGTTLREMRDLASTVGRPMRAVRRVDPSGGVLVPALVHWSVGHFAALVEERNGRYLIMDPVFGHEKWISRSAFDEEASGFALITPGGDLPWGWRDVDADEADRVWGRGATPSNDPEQCKPCNPKSGGDQGGCHGPTCTGMARYAVHSMLVSLNLVDTPVGYSPPRGPAVQFTATYNQRDSFQPQIFSYWNLGTRWTSDWLSYVTDDPTDPAQPVTVYIQGGGQETYTGYDPGTARYALHRESRARVSRPSTSPLRYERLLPDGSLAEYAQPDGALTFPRRVFLTRLADPQGNSLTLTYDATLRLVAVTDAIGQVTTLAYEHPADILKVTKVTDPFGRAARLEYDAQGRLQKITDVIGIESMFEYSATDFVQGLTTPYGRQVFREGGVGTQRWIEATDPLGGRERVEYLSLTSAIPAHEPVAAPTGFNANNNILNTRNTFYWSKGAYQAARGDYTKAQILHWLHTLDGTQTGGSLESEKKPLEHRVYYAYPGQAVSWWEGTSTSPSKVARTLDDGTTQLYQYEYNARGHKTKETDPLGRETVYVYGTNNVPDANPTTGEGMDLLQVKQKNGSGYDLIESRTYNAQHQPLTVTDAAGQATTYTYLPNGRLETVVSPARNGPGGQPLTISERTTTYEYFPDDAPAGAGALKKVTGPSTPQGSPTSEYTYDAHGRVRTTTNSDNYTLTYDYDALDRRRKTTYPDGTYEETTYNRLDAEGRRDRLGRWSSTFHDPLRRVVATRDAAGDTTQYQYGGSGCTSCAGGGDRLTKLIDPNGNATTWDYDLQGRVTSETRADQAQWLYTYEATTSRLRTVTDPRGNVKTYSYYLDDNPQSTTYSVAAGTAPTANVGYTYDPAYNRVATMTDGTGTTTYASYTVTSPPTLGAGQLASVDGPLANDTVSYGYDELGYVATRGLPGFASSLTYDALGRLGSETTPVGMFTYAYDSVTSRPLSLSYPNGQATSYSYFANGGDHRLQQIKHLAPGGATISQYDYTHDSVANLLTWSQQVGTNPAKLYTFGYDAANQLTSARVSGPNPLPAPSRFGYAYDPARNRTAEQLDDAVMGASYNNRNELTSRQAGGALVFKGAVDEAATVTVGGEAAQVAADNSFAGQAQVSSGTANVVVAATDASGNTRTNTYQVNQSGATSTYTYDANGNLTGDGTKTYEWDAENRLVAVLQGSTTLATFAYDGRGRRIQQVKGGVTHSYIHDFDEVIEERLSSGPIFRYVHGPGIDQHWAVQDDAGTVSYYLSDHLGSIVQTTNVAGSVTLAREYDPYGRLFSGASAAGYAFTGREWDPDTGLYYYRARYYDAQLARFLSDDPMHVLRRSEREINSYAYVANSPVQFIDPYGLLMVHGNWCGSGPPTGSNPPSVDVVDDACRDHDKCYDRIGVTAASRKKDMKDPKKCELINDCDSKFCDQLYRVKDPDQKQLRAIMAITSYFKCSRFRAGSS